VEELTTTKRRVNGLWRTDNRNICGFEFRNGLCSLTGTTKVDKGEDVLVLDQLGESNG